mgnify:CR=1 FL=1
MDHLARNCDKPLNNHLLMLAENPYNLTAEESYMLLMQGTHPSINDVPEDIFALDDWAAVYVLNPKMEEEEQDSQTIQSDYP